MIKNPKILVTGATGFIGSHLLVKLIDLNFEVMAIARKNGPDLGKNLSWLASDIASLDEIKDKIDSEFREYLTDDEAVTELLYPVEAYPEKVKSVGFDKLPEISGQLRGIKGQYLLLDENRVLNMRKHTGYHIEVSA